MIIQGSYDAATGAEVLVDGKPLDPKKSQKVRNHSPDGFNWGYGGSGPAQLALAIILAAGFSAEEAQEVYQDFKWAYIARLPQAQDFRLELDVKAWVLGRMAAKREVAGG